MINAVESAPSANKSRNRFGTRNAIRNASRFLPAPKSPAKTCSRINPKNTRAKDSDANHPGRSGAYSLRFRLSHRRTKNNVRELTKAKNAEASRLGLGQQEALVNERRNDRYDSDGDERADSIKLFQTV